MSDGSSSDAFDQQDSRGAQVLDAISAMAPELYVTIGGRAMVKIPFNAALNEREAWPINYARVRAEISLFAFQPPRRIVLRDREVAEIVRILTGMAWKNLRSATSLLEAFDQSSLIETLYTFITDEELKGHYKDSATALGNELRATARSLGIMETQQTWPQGPSQLSCALAELARCGALGRFGISFERPDNARPRYVELFYHPERDSALPPSEQRRHQNSQPQPDLTNAGDGDGARRALFEELKSPSS